MTAATSHTLVCTECGQLNRVPAGKALSQGKCGTCGVTLATKKPRDIDGATLSKLIAKDTGMYVLDLWAPWCGPCRMMAPSYAQTAEALGDQVRFFKLNTDENQQAAGRFNIRGIPTLIAFKDGKQAGIQSGAMQKPQLMAWTGQTLGIPQG